MACVGLVESVEDVLLQFVFVIFVFSLFTGLLPGSCGSTTTALPAPGVLDCDGVFWP